MPEQVHGLEEIPEEPTIVFLLTDQYPYRSLQLHLPPDFRKKFIFRLTGLFDFFFPFFFSFLFVYEQLIMRNNRFFFLFPVFK